MGEDPRQLERQIERTRESLGYDVDALADKVSPGRIVERRMSSVKGSVNGLRDRVMGTTQDTASTLSDQASESVDTLRRKAEGNPLAAGLVAFGIGWLVSSLVPTTDKETQLAGQVEQTVKENAGPVTEQLKGTAQEMGDHLRQPAREAAQSVKDKATDAMQQVGDEGRSAVTDVTDSRMGVQQPS